MPRIEIRPASGGAELRDTGSCNSIDVLFQIAHRLQNILKRWRRDEKHILHYITGNKPRRAAVSRMSKACSGPVRLKNSNFTNYFSASSRKSGCIHAGASGISFNNRCRSLIGRVRFKCSTRADVM
jgi:hypothetical protein